MDPDETLKRAREAYAQYTARPTHDAAEALAEAFTALDGWITRGGFLPRDWATQERNVTSAGHQAWEITALRAALESARDHRAALEAGERYRIAQKTTAMDEWPPGAPS